MKPQVVLKKIQKPTLKQMVDTFLMKVAEEHAKLVADSPELRIRQAALTHFANFGYHVTSIREIANTAGVNPAMIHYYFQNKKQLYLSVMHWQMKQGFLKVFQALSMNKKPQEILYQLPDKIVEMFIENPIWTRFIRREIADGGENLKIVVNEMGESGPLGIIKIIHELLLQSGINKNIDRTTVAIFMSQIFVLLFLQPFHDIITDTNGSDLKVMKNRCKRLQQIVFEGLFQLK